MFVKCISRSRIAVVLLWALLECVHHGSEAVRILNVRNSHRMQPRSLVYPPTAPTRVQFIGGVGIPVEDLRFESVTSGYVLKAEYFLPIHPDEYRHKVKPQSIHRRRRSSNVTDFGDISNERPLLMSAMGLFGDHGPANETLKYDNETHRRMDENWKSKRQHRHAGVYRWVLYKAIEMVLNNSALSGHVCLLRSICEHAAMPFGYESGLLAEILHIILTPSTSRDDFLNSGNNEYLKAELLGHSGQSCSTNFEECKKSPMEIISTIFDY